MCLTFNELKMWWAEKVSLIWNLFLHHPLTQIKTLMSSHTHLPLELLTLLFHLPTSLLPLHSLLVDPWQHSLTYTLHHHCHQTWRSGGLWRTVLSQICCFFLLGVFFFFWEHSPPFKPRNRTAHTSCQTSMSASAGWDTKQLKLYYYDICL